MAEDTQNEEASARSRDADCSDMDNLLAELNKRGPCTQTCVRVDPESMAVEIFLKDCSHYGEWIKGEGGDICLYRDNYDNSVVGARLPLFHREVVVVVGFVNPNAEVELPPNGGSESKKGVVGG